MRIDVDIDAADAARIAAVAVLPRRPDLLAALMSEAGQPQPDASRVGRLLARDATLSEALLRTLNSPLHGRREKLVRIDAALARTGLERTGILLAGIYLTRTMQELRIPAVTEYWAAATQMSMVVAYLARELGAGDFDEAQTCGLFRYGAVGCMLSRFPSYRGFLGTVRADDPGQVLLRESVQFGVNRARVGAVLARTWRMPERIWLPILLQHVRDPRALQDVRADVLRMVAVGALADCLERSRAGLDAHGAWAREEAFARHVLDVRHDTLESLRSDVALMLEGIC